MSVLFTHEDERVEIPLSEYETLKTLGPKIAEQNALVLNALKTLTDSIAETQRQQQAANDNLAAFASVVTEALKNMSVTVNVPELPAPVVNVTVPEQSAPVVNFTPPAEGKRRMTLKAKRDNKGFVTGFEGTTE